MNDAAGLLRLLQVVHATPATLKAVQAAVEAELGDRPICRRCGAILEVYGEGCIAGDGWCEGDATVTAALERAVRLLEEPASHG